MDGVLLGNSYPITAVKRIFLFLRYPNLFSVFPGCFHMDESSCSSATNKPATTTMIARPYAHTCLSHNNTSYTYLLHLMWIDLLLERVTAWGFLRFIYDTRSRCIEEREKGCIVPTTTTTRPGLTSSDQLCFVL